jgi:predicted acyl esterase
MKTMMRRALYGLYFAALITSYASAGAPGPGYDIDVSHMIPMRDGVELEAWITKPSNLSARVPTILPLSQSINWTEIDQQVTIASDVVG